MIGFKPKWQPDDHASFFTAAEGWGLFTQKRTASRQTHHIELAYGRLSLRELVFELPVAARAATCTVRVADRGPSASVALDGGELRVTLDDPIMLEAGGALEVDVGIR